MIDQMGGLAAEQVELIPAEDAVLAISFTPYTPSTLDLAARAVRRQVPLVAITDTPFSPLAQGASVWLEVAEADHAALRSLAATFVLAMTLAVGIAEQRR
jgi:DNA-binding MurR/RpiR family transcriptional regulator